MASIVGYGASVWGHRLLLVKPRYMQIAEGGGSFDRLSLLDYVIQGPDDNDRRALPTELY